ncbi:MAG: cytoplasmic protein [Planctomycetota bacterium]|nr:cytoplasmic protein [Planctomycetota bacterium]
MDSSLGSVVARANVQNQVSVSVAKTALNQQRAQGEAAVQLIQAAAKVAEATSGQGSGQSGGGNAAGSGGGRFDRYA